MTAYLAILRTRYLVLLQYRAAAIAGILTQTFFGLVRIMVLEGFYENSAAASPMTHAQMVAYVWLGQAFLMLLPWGVDNEVRESIRSGGVAYELVRPLDLYNTWFFRTIALRLAPTTLRALPMFVIAFACFQLQPPASWESGLAWAAATVGSLLLAAAITMLITITLMWTIAGEGAAQILPVISYLAGGLIIPLPMFPAWAQKVLAALPFSGLMDTPFRLYSGHIPAADVGWVLLHQFLWTVALIVLGRWLLKRGLTKLVVQGG